ncbi:MAG: hypothetical protein HY721_31675 [Planctomycetes bacterium]|nr:hypothetical protein [Planctomycetota bacterium]
MKENLTEGQILRALERLAGLLKERQVQGEICFLGGAAMVLAFKARPSTKDVDAVFEPPQVIRDLSLLVHREQGLPESWLNDAAKGYVSTRHDVAVGDLPQFESLRLTAPTAEYLLAMKCMASRIPGRPEDRGDVQDIQFLIQRLALRSAEEAMAIVARYYPEDRVPPRARFLLEDIFEELGGGP